MNTFKQINLSNHMKKFINTSKFPNIIITTTFILAGSVATSLAAQAKNVAVLVGIDDYMYNGKNKTVIEDLRGASNDAKSMREALIKNWNFAPKDITLLTDTQATHANIMQALNDLQTNSSVGDEILIYFSGHGTSVYDKNSRFYHKNVFLSKNSGAFLPTDYNDEQVKNLINNSQIDKAIKNQLITGQYHLRPIISKLDKDRKVTAIIDSCYSENSFRSAIKKGGRYVAKSPSGIAITKPRKKLEYVTDTNTFNDSKFPYKNTITLSASSKGEVAHDLQDPKKTFDNKPHGMLTDMLLRVLTNPSIASGNDGVVTYTDLKQYIEDTKINYEKHQTPIFQPVIEQRSIVREQNTIGIMNRPLFGVSNTAPRMMTGVQPVKIKVNAGKSTLLSKVDKAIFEVVTSGLADFELSQSAGKWILTAGNGQTITHTANFEDIRNRIEAEYWLKKVRATSKDTTKSEFSATPESNGNSFDAGDKFQLLTQFDKNSAVLIFNINSKGRITILYPFYSQENIIHPANTMLTVPNDEKLNVAPPYGLEKMVMVTLQTPLSKTERNQLSVLMDLNKYSIQSQPISQLTQLLKQSATSISTINLQTFAK